MRAAKIRKVGSAAPLWGTEDARTHSGPQGAGATRFRMMIGFMLLLASSIIGNLFAQAGSHQESAKSVVKITSRFAGGKVEVGTGFVWSQPDYVVTALHVVAGAASIEVYSETLKKERGADILAVHQESDLALLKLKTNDLALKPLKIASVPPNSEDRHYIWGYPHDVNTMQGKKLEFSSSLQQQSTMGSIFKSEAHFESVVGKQGYPKYAAKILRVETTIRPGHSGAPIFDKSGAVVGIGDGGLHQGIASINWAIPAEAYVPALPASKDPKPTEPSKQANLYSAHAEKPVEVKIATAPEDAAQDPNGEEEEEQSLVLAWSAPLSDILATAEAEQVQEVEAMELPDWSKIIIDVYEDYETGATIAVPQGTSLTFDPEDRMVEAESEGGKVRMIVYVAQGGGKDAQEYFDAYVSSLKEWQPDPEEPDEPPYEEKDFFALTKTRVTFDEEGETQGNIFISLLLDGPNFLGTAVMAEDVQALSPDEFNLYKLMLLCVELADFAIE